MTPMPTTTRERLIGMRDAAPELGELCFLSRGLWLWFSVFFRFVISNEGSVITFGKLSRMAVLYLAINSFGIRDYRGNCEDIGKDYLDRFRGKTTIRYNAKLPVVRFRI